jgi:hypothetical protein
MAFSPTNAKAQYNLKHQKIAMLLQEIYHECREDVKERADLGITYDPVSETDHSDFVAIEGAVISFMEGTANGKTRLATTLKVAEIGGSA